MSFFPFCPLCQPPPFLPFSRHLFALFSASKSALFCRAKGIAQSLERGSLRMDLSTKFGKEIPSRNLRKRRSVWGPETGVWGGGLPPQGVGVEKFVPSLESLFSLGSVKERNLGCPGNFAGMSREFCRDVPDPWGCSKSLCKKSSCAFFVP